MAFVVGDEYISGTIQIKMYVNELIVVQIAAHVIGGCRMANNFTGFPIVLIS